MDFVIQPDSKTVFYKMYDACTHTHIHKYVSQFVTLLSLCNGS